ncbi:molybdopterin-dependent oxidoreductase [Pseudoduganella eburnea]|uniref:Molybdopterin-dependent oxidoreductase n=1 Tax=Massilia eburnea TaxID=1776165 RepID=A0A6L6QIU1_9BURK|nr:molybdopterin-dependent oxidoreductase [Massilia eburnea]MTW11857.1 molybdopterin-dependent oxidoreductase [Massilia eburnea]
MKKRQFLGAVAAAGALPSLGTAAPKAERGPTLLTVTGAIAKANRGGFDRVADQMMHRQRLSFEKAFTFDFAALAALPAVTISPTLEYDSRVHTLSGPLLVDVLKAAGAKTGDNSNLVLRAVDGYAVAVALARARAQRFIVATHMDGAPMALGGLGPLWAIYDADRVPEMAGRPVGERFTTCPWALYHIEVQA